MSERLKTVEDAVKKAVNQVLPSRPEESGKASKDQKKIVTSGKKDVEGKDDNKEKQTRPETEEEHQVEVELGSILKRSPSMLLLMVIMSHSEYA